MPTLDRYLAEGAMEIWVHPEAQFIGDVPEPRASVLYLQEKLGAALARGYAGMRVAGSPACLQRANTETFREFEQALGGAIVNQRMIALCHFPLAESGAVEIVDAARTHQFVVARREGDWEILESPEIRLAKAEITKLNEQLEQRVEERTRALEAANDELRKEIARRECLEEDLRHQKEILQTIINHVPLILKFVDKEGRIQMLNREWERVLGRTLDEIVNQGVDIYEEGYPDPLERQRVLDFVKNSNGEWMDFKTRVKDGRVIDTSWAVVRLSDGATICIGQDISARKQAERDLWKQKEILQTIFDHIPVMINFVDQNHQIQLINREWEQTLGWSLEEIQSQNIDIVEENYPAPEYRKQIRDFIVNSNGAWADFKTTVRDGRVIDTSWAMLHLSDGTGIGIGQDITKRKRSEEALKESEERFRQLAENIHDLFWIKAADFKRVLYLSPVYQSLSGHSPEERYQDQDYQPFLDRIVPEDRERMAEIMRQGASEEFEIEFRIRHPDSDPGRVRTDLSHCGNCARYYRTQTSRRGAARKRGAVPPAHREYTRSLLAQVARLEAIALCESHV
jgi:PAS domain S-box-containing protein